MRVGLPEMNVEHPPQKLLLFESVAYEIETDIRAGRAPRAQEVVVGIGLYDQLCLFHATMMPQVRMLKRGCGN
jgi:hypothetical protein